MKYHVVSILMSQTTLSDLKSICELQPTERVRCCVVFVMADHSNDVKLVQPRQLKHTVAVQPFLSKYM